MPVYSVEAPIGGWNARDALDNIPETDAIELLNLIPREGYVQARAGVTRILNLDPGATLGDTDVETVMSFTNATTSEWMYAAYENIYDENATRLNSVDGEFSTNRWQYAVTHGRIILVNGLDAPQEYDGTTFQAISTFGGVGLTVSDLIGVMPFKGRVFYWEDGATSFWYPGAGEYKNAAMSEYDMAQFLTRGGTLTLAFTWTLDGGAGMDDLAVFVFSSGETLVYQGSDPGSASDWALVGRFQIGEPLGNRAHCRLGSDHVILTRDGYERISYSLQSGEGLSRKISDKISGAVNDAIRSYGDNTQWDVTFYPEESLLLVNVPVDPGNDNYEQHVLNVTTGAWCKWDVGGFSFAVHDGNLYVGKVTSIDRYNGLTSQDDLESFINYQATQITSFKKASVRKQLTGLNLLMTHDNQEEVYVTTASDFNTPAQPTQSTVTQSASTTTTQKWRIMAEAGYAISFRWRSLSAGNLFRWYATQMTYKVGGPV